jgi:hypothetical protein
MKPNRTETVFFRPREEKTVSSSEFPRRRPGTAFRSVGDDGGLVVVSERSEVKVLNPVAIRIFELLDGEHSTEQIARLVVDEFDVALEQAERDVRAFLEELAEHGILDEAGATGGGTV